MQVPDTVKTCLTGAVKILVIALLTSFSSSQEVQFRASAPSQVEVGQQFRLTYTINTHAGDMRLPDLTPFRLVSGPNTSSSSSVQIINGQMTQTRTVTLTYTLLATETGNFTLAPATMSIDADRHTSNSITIEVVSDSEGRSQIPGQSPATTRPRDISGEDIFVRIHIDRNEVYQGEGFLATIKLYSKLDLTGIENVRLPALTGFYQQDLETPPLRSLDREVINGEIYGTGVLKQMLLFPQRSGELRIESFSMDAVVRQRTGRRGSLFDDFFGGVETRRIPVESLPLTLKVKPLPGQRPAGFGGGVGSFSIKSEFTPTEARTNEAMTIRLTISGKGNLQLLRKPEIDFPHGFEVYDPGIRQNITNSTGGQQGEITWEYLVIPRSPGNFRIPPVDFSYFDPSSGTYRNATSGELSLLVEKGEEPDGGTGIAGPVREDLRILGRDIRYIKVSGVVLREMGNDPFGNVTFYLWFIGPLMIFSVFIFLQTKKIRERSDIAGLRNRRASKMARNRLHSAGRHLRENNSPLFFEETLKAIWGYLSDKLLIPVSELNRHKTKAALADKNMQENDINRLIDIIDQCEYARYAPVASASDKNRIYDDTVQMITLIEQNLRK